MSQIEPSSAPSAVAKMFEPTKVFQERLTKLGTAFDQVDRLGKEATSAFGQVSELADHLDQFAGAIKKFQSEMTVLAQKFDPFKGIHNQLTEMPSSFCDHLHYLGAVLEPASKIQQRLSELASALEPANELKKRFLELEREFETLANSSPEGTAQSSSSNKADPASASRVIPIGSNQDPSRRAG